MHELVYPFYRTLVLGWPKGMYMHSGKHIDLSSFSNLPSQPKNYVTTRLCLYFGFLDTSEYLGVGSLILAVLGTSGSRSFALTPQRCCTLVPQRKLGDLRVCYGPSISRFPFLRTRPRQAGTVRWWTQPEIHPPPERSLALEFFERHPLVLFLQLLPSPRLSMVQSGRVVQAWNGAAYAVT